MTTKNKDHDREDGDKKRRPSERVGHVAPQDPQLVTFLDRLWTRGNPPERMELWWMLGANKDLRRALVFKENFTPEEKLDIEECTKLAGDILTAAQNWTDRKEKKCWFELAVLDSYQQTTPLTRPVGPLVPQQGYAGVGPDGEPKSSEEDEDAEIGLKPLTHRYLSKTMRSIDRRQAQIDAVLGDTMQMQQLIIAGQQAHIERLLGKNIEMHATVQDAADRSLDREVVRDREKVKTKAIGSGINAGINLLNGWIGMSTAETPAIAERSESSGGGASPARRFGVSPEQSIVENFLKECGDDKKVAVELFGDWNSTPELSLPEIFAGFGLLKPGIFTPQQFGTLLAVAEGMLPPQALYDLMPDSGKPLSISGDQMARAAPFMTQGMMVALHQIQEICTKKREAAAGTAAPQGVAQ